MNSPLQPFQNQAFLNLETFRKDGTGVKTPVWFVQDGDLLYMRTVADSWKVKRVRSNPQVNVVPCKAQGEPLGEWAPAQARRVEDAAREAEINQLLNKKYGAQKRMFDMMGKLRKDQMAVLEIQVTSE